MHANICNAVDYICAIFYQMHIICPIVKTLFMALLQGVRKQTFLQDKPKLLLTQILRYVALQPETQAL